MDSYFEMATFPRLTDIKPVKCCEGNFCCYEPSAKEQDCIHLAVPTLSLNTWQQSLGINPDNGQARHYQTKIIVNDTETVMENDTFD